MWIIDRQRYWAFFKAYLICFTALVGLVLVIDAFANLDEFTKVAIGMQVFKNMGRYYLIRMSMYYDLLSGVIVMMAAVFTVTWMQRNNELLAMLAAGVSTHRAIRPVLISALLVNLAVVLNQEFIMPQIAEELQKPPDDFEGRELVHFHSRRDVHGITITSGKKGHPAIQTVTEFHAIFPIPLIGELGSISAAEARYIPDEETELPIQGGWLLRGANLNPPDAQISPDFLMPLDDPEVVAELPPPLESLSTMVGQTYFLRTNVSFQAITRDHRRWFRYASTLELIQALGDPANDPEHLDIAVFLHTRTIRPLLGMAVLCVTLPMVLSGYGRNTFLNLGFSLATSAAFYMALFGTQYLGGSGIVPPELASWGPLIGFGTLAAARWDRIRT